MATPSAKKLLAWAKKGDVDALLELCDVAQGGEDDEEAGDGEGDQLAYKWLLVAEDFGHEKAGKAADDMLEWSSFRYDDGALLQGLIALELGQAYLSARTDCRRTRRKHARISHTQRSSRSTRRPMLPSDFRRFARRWALPARRFSRNIFLPKLGPLASRMRLRFE